MAEVNHVPFMPFVKGFVVDAFFGALPYVEKFVNDQDAHFIAQVQHFRRRRVVGRADGVDVVLFEKKDVFLGVFSRNGMAEVGMELVTVYAADFEFLAVELYVRLFAVD